MPDAGTALLTLVGGLWAATNTILTGAKTVNEWRDKIVLGTDGKNEIPVEYRQVMLRYDWLPMTSGLGLICLLFFIFITSIPILIPELKAVLLVFLGCAIVPLIGAASFLFSAIMELECPP
jgi:hypothetical protein